MSTTRHQHPTPPTFDLVRLVGGPLAGQVLRTIRTAQAMLFLRTSRAPGAPIATYCGDTTTGALRFDRLIEGRPKRRAKGDRT